MNVAGARIAREAAGDRFVAGSVGPLNVTLSLSPEGRRPVLPDAHLRPGQGGVRRADGGARRGRRRPAAARDGLRHAEREGRDRGRARDGAASCRSGSRPRSSTAPGGRSPGQTIEAFWASIEHADPLIVGHQLLARRARDALVRRRPRARRAVPRERPPERRAAERLRRLRRDARGDEHAPARVRRRRAS